MTTAALADVHSTTYDTTPIPYKHYSVDHIQPHDRTTIIHDLRNMVDEAEATSLHEFSMADIINSAEQQR